MCKGVPFGSTNAALPEPSIRGDDLVIVAINAFLINKEVKFIFFVKIVCIVSQSIIHSFSAIFFSKIKESIIIIIINNTYFIYKYTKQIKSNKKSDTSKSVFCDIFISLVRLSSVKITVGLSAKSVSKALPFLSLSNP